MKRITIIIDEDTWDRLPVKGKSPFINLVLKNHFRKDNAEEFYKYIKQRLVKDGLVNDGSVAWNTIPAYNQPPRTCCTMYPNEDCGHWYTDEDGFKINEITKERHA